MKDFLNFVRTQGVVGLAVGFILGGAVSTVVQSVVNDLINPIIGILLNKTHGLTTAVISVAGAEIKYGNFISVLINFCVIAAVVYFGVKKLGLDRLDKSKETQPE